MTIYLLRHGETAWNRLKRYQGTRDVPLSPEGIAALRRAPFCPTRVYVSTLQRTAQTATVLFPGAEQVIVPDLREMNFGRFEGHSYVDMENDPDYRAWVTANCTSPCPDGEARDEFVRRTCAAFCALVNEALRRRESELVILAHGGTQMAVLSEYAADQKAYHEWCAPNAGGYRCRLNETLWPEKRSLVVETTVCYAAASAGSF